MVYPVTVLFATEEEKENFKVNIPAQKEELSKDKTKVKPVIEEPVLEEE